MAALGDCLAQLGKSPTEGVGSLWSGSRRALALLAGGANRLHGPAGAAVWDLLIYDEVGRLVDVAYLRAALLEARA